MYKKEEAKNIRMEFWSRFEAYSAVRRRQKGKPVKWIMNKTGIPQLKLKFEFDKEKAIVGIDIETRNVDKRIEIFGRLEELKKKLEDNVKNEFTWDLEYILENKKSISRVYLKMENVSIYNPDDWPDVFPFFYKNMMKIEAFFGEYRDILKA